MMRGDRTALAELFDRYYADLFGYGLRLVGREDLVRDSIQDVFLRLWDRRDRLAEVRSVRGYLIASMRRRVLRRRDQQARRAARNERYVADVVPSLRDRGGPAFVLTADALANRPQLRTAEYEALSHALEHLTDRQREALYLRFYHDLTYDEIAAALEIRNQTARNYVSAALKRLRHAMEALSADPSSSPLQ